MFNIGLATIVTKNNNHHLSVTYSKTIGNLVLKNFIWFNKILIMTSLNQYKNSIMAILTTLFVI